MALSYRDVPAALCHALLGLPGTDRLTLREAVLLHITAERSATPQDLQPHTP
jgi:hypothetical protein